MTINFYSTRGDYGCFSNFSKHGFELDGHFWKTSEHYFQAQKFVSSEDDFLAVRDAKTPKDSATIGRDRNRPLREDWEEVKDDVMRAAVLAKFEAHPSIKSTLLSTGDEELIEKTTSDYYWGIGTKGTGKNMLGIILMEVRTTLRES